MKVRIGFGGGARGGADRVAQFAELVDRLEADGFDSLWCSERATGPMPDPIVALTFAAGRTRSLKLGTSVQVLPGRNPVLLAKQWASLDVLSGGRALPAFGLGVVDAGEQQAFGVTREERAALFDEALPLVRRLWDEETVDHDGPRFHYEGASIGLRPPHRLDVWLGGRVPAELRRVGRLADGWLPSFCTPEQVARDRKVVDEAASAVGRTIDPEHYGAMVFYTRGELPAAYARMMAERRGVDVGEVVVTGLDALRDRMQEFVGVGFSKLVAVPVHEVTSWADELASLADAVLDLQT
ncbi:MAG TPA: LLM class flavin-dependent oxidoreductase [Gaiellaceae bacterium]|nr:LLM class flavin-dependent oxidoreductase [Gaiellaceae bacterium]